MNPVKIKFCGFTQSYDLSIGVEAGADLFGMVLAPGSRQVTEDFVSQSSFDTGSFSPYVVVMVNPDLDFVLRIHKNSNLYAIQFHGDESPDFCQRAAHLTGLRVVKGLPANRMFDAPLIEGYLAIDGLFLLADTPGHARGGTGEPWEWSRLAQLPWASERLFVAGGLTSETVGAVVRTVRPYGVDVSSGIESSPGRKSPQKMRQFIEAVKNAQS